MVDLLNNSYLQWSYGIRLHSALVCKRATGPFWKHGSSAPNFFNAALKVNWSERVMWDCWLMIYASRLCSSPGFSAAKSSACSTGDTTRTSQPPCSSPQPLRHESPRDTHTSPGAEGSSTPPVLRWAPCRGAPGEVPPLHSSLLLQETQNSPNEESECTVRAGRRDVLPRSPRNRAKIFNLPFMTAN